MSCDAFEHPSQSDRYRASQIVYRIGDDGHTIGEPPPDEGDDGEREVDEEGREDILSCALAVQMDMIVNHNDYFIAFFVN